MHPTPTPSPLATPPGFLPDPDMPDLDTPSLDMPDLDTPEPGPPRRTPRAPVHTETYEQWEARRQGAEAQSGRFVTLSAPDLVTRRFPPRETLLSPWLPARGLAMVYGPRGIGKTHFSLGVAHALATGGPFLRWQAPKPLKVLVVDGEMPAVALQERLQALGPMSPNLRFLAMDLQHMGMDLGLEDDWNRLEAVVGDAQVLIMDNISTLAGGGRENEAESWHPVQHWALTMRRRDRTVLFIHHSGKGGQQRGTSKREDVLDTVVALRKPADYSAESGARFEVHFEKARNFHGADALPFEAALGQGGVWTTAELSDPQADRVADLRRQGRSMREISAETGLGLGTVGRMAQRTKDAKG